MFRKSFLFISLCIMLSLLLAACGTPQPQTFTVGVVNLTPTLNPTFDGFKAGMAELGYVEGENVTYIYEGPVGAIDALEPAIQKLMEAKPDLVLSISTPATLRAKAALEGTDIPLVFSPVNDPVGSGVVDSLRNPGGNLTGVKGGGGGAIPKTVEWLLTVVPDTTRLFVLHNPEDNSSVQALAELNETAAKLGVELVVREVRTPDEIMAAMESIPEDVDAIFIPPSGPITANIADIVEAAIERDLPIATSVGPLVQAGVQITYGTDHYRMGEHVARLADQILQGTDPADLPVETAEFYLSINLQTAETIGLDIPDDILRQADTVVR